MKLGLNWSSSWVPLNFKGVSARSTNKSQTLYFAVSPLGDDSQRVHVRGNSIFLELCLPSLPIDAINAVDIYARIVSARACAARGGEFEFPSGSLSSASLIFALDYWNSKERSTRREYFANQSFIKAPRVLAGVWQLILGQNLVQLSTVERWRIDRQGFRVFE